MSADYAAILEDYRNRAERLVDDLQGRGINSNADGWLQPTALVIPLEDAELLVDLLPEAAGRAELERRVRERLVEEVHGRFPELEPSDDHDEGVLDVLRFLRGESR